MKITPINTNNGYKKIKATPISFKSDNNTEYPKTAQFEKNLKPITMKPVKKSFATKLLDGLKGFFQPNAQSTISAETFGIFY